MTDDRPISLPSTAFPPAVMTAVATAMGVVTFPIVPSGPNSDWKSRSAVSWRKLLLANRYALAGAWERVFPKHDIVTLRLKSPPSPEWWDDSWRSAARSYHEERKRTGKKVPIPPASCQTFEEKVEWYAQQQAQQQNGSHFQQLQRLSDESVSLDRAWHELNRPDRFSTPQTTIEAILYCVRERGLGALKEPKNIERLSQCDKPAREQMDRRIEKLISNKEISHETCSTTVL